jgi:hypothetical protein
MRKVLSRSLLTAAATTGVLAGFAGYAQADSQADSGAAGSPGVLSGNSVQAPVHLPANACGNSVSVVGLLNPTFGNGCVTHSSAQHTSGRHQGGDNPGGHRQDGPHRGGHQNGEKPVGTSAQDPAQGPAEKPAEDSQRTREQPADKPAAQPPERPDTERAPAARPAQERPADPAREAAPRAPEQPDEVSRAGAVLAETGSSVTGIAAVVGVGTLLGGVVLYRRSTARRG